MAWPGHTQFLNVRLQKAHHRVENMRLRPGPLEVGLRGTMAIGRWFLVYLKYVGFHCCVLLVET